MLSIHDFRHERGVFIQPIPGPRQKKKNVNLLEISKHHNNRRNLIECAKTLVWSIRRLNANKLKPTTNTFQPIEFYGMLHSNFKSVNRKYFHCARSPYLAYRRRWKLTSKIQFKLVPRLSCQRARIIQISNPANGRTVTRKVNSASFQRSNQKSFVNSIAYSHRINLLLLLLCIPIRYLNYSLLVAEQNTYAITNTARTDLIALEILTAFYAQKKPIKQKQNLK